MNNLKLIHCSACLFLIFWIFASLLFSLFFNSISIETWLYFLGFGLVMYIGNLSGKTFSVKVIYRKKNQDHLKFITLLTILITFIYIKHLVEYMLQFSSISNALSEIRRANLNGEAVIPFYNFYILSTQTLLSISILGLILNSKKNASLFIIGFLMSIISSLLDGSRSFAITGVVWLLFSFLLTGKLKFSRFIFYISIMLFLFSATFSLFRPVTESYDFLIGFKYLVVYISGGIGALEFAANNDIQVYWQDLESISNKLSILGLPFDTYDLSLLKMDFSYLTDDFDTNVYTALGVYVQYMGFIGSLFFAFILGITGSILSNISRSNIYGSYVYALFLTALLLMLFHDYFISYTYLFIKIMAFVSITIIIKKFLSISLSEVKL